MNTSPSPPPAPRAVPGAPTPAHSLRKRLLLLLLASIALFAAIQGVGAYRSALQQADALFDYHLRQMAHAMPRGADPRPPPGDEEDFDFLVQIWGPDGAQLFRSPRSALPRSGVLGFSDVTVQGQAFRVYTVQTPWQTVQIAQDLDARNARARAIAAHAVLPVALMAPLLMLVVWWVVSRSLAPVERARRQVAVRAADDLSPLAADGLPDEVRPLVDELNGLFGRVREAFEAQQNFVADAAHELRSPLAALKLQAQALRGGGGDEAAIARLNQGIDRAIHLVEQLLALARAEGAPASVSSSRAEGAPTSVSSSRAEGAPTSVSSSRADGTPASAWPSRANDASTRADLQDVIREAVGDVLPRARAAGIDLGLSPDALASPALVAGDAQALRMMLRNLLDNAVKYTLAPGRVDVDLRAEGAAYVLTVDDSGPGIAPAERTRVFDRFYRAPAAHGTATGSGLGLSIVQAIARRHGAQLALDTAPGLGGLRVQVRLAAA